MNDPWQGPPKWNGKYVDPDWTDLFYPSCAGAPLVTLLEGTDDQFSPCFSSHEKLREYMVKLTNQLGPIQYDISHIPEEKIPVFYQALRASNLRVMVDPKIVSPHHTKWFEIIQQGEEIKYINTENN